VTFKIRIPVSAVLAACLIGLPPCSAEKELSKSDKRWLEEEVAALIAKEEARIFKELDSEKDRNQFKELFWIRRDPNLMTPENEFRAEFERRVHTANRNFSRKGRRGAATDMGEVFLLLGRPARTDQTHHEGAGATEGVRTITWTYEPNPQQGIPDGFVAQFQSQSGLGSRLRSSEEVEDALERIRNHYVVNPGVDYSRNESGRLLEPPSRFDPRSPAKKILRKTIERKVELTKISFDTEIGPFRATGATYIPILFRIDPESLSWDDEVAQVTVFGLVESAEGLPIKYFEEPVKLARPEGGPATFEMPIELPAGSYTFNLGILDDRSKSAGTRRVPLLIPDFDSRHH
jgi:GWxTD domain-containing protein